MIRFLTDLIGGRVKFAAAAAGAIALAGCANLPADEANAPSGATAAPAPAPKAATTTPVPAAAPSAAPSTTKSPTKTVTLPQTGRVSLAEYRAQMRDQLMKTENASAEVADCAAHASWVVPRSSGYDALKIPTGALASDRASVERWEGRFSQGKQAVPVSTVVSFNATAHKRGGDGDWQPVKVRCGYDDGMMLAYELLDGSGSIIAEAPAAPAVRTTSHATGKSRKGKSGKAGASHSGGKSSAKATKSSKATSSTSSKSSKSSKKKH